MVKHNVKDLFFGHCVTTDKTPRLTISSHPLQDGQQVWYLGGTLAEKGVAQSPQQLIDTAKEELGALMPWIDFSNAEWATLAVDRAEPRQQKMMRPDNAFAQWAEGPANIMAAWPTKLTLSPHLSEEIERLLRIRNISPGDTTFASLPLPKPEIATTPWHEAFSRAK